MKKILLAVAAFPAVVASSAAFAQAGEIATAATTALGTTKSDVTSVGVIVAGVIALMAGAALIFAMLKKG